MTDYVAQAQLAEELRKHGIDPARLPPACLHEFVAKAESVADLTRALHGSASEALSDHLYGMAALIAQTLRGEAPGENLRRKFYRGTELPSDPKRKRCRRRKLSDLEASRLALQSASRRAPQQSNGADASGRPGSCRNRAFTLLD
jgi:hypothetical protein